ncbi:hypothetical protein Cgig2_005552 [Carnegiea gigantea]|uniref:serine C-palmitoyltransferase n=1 Tax=Carnegiea gigantea TaxID=171969 RepID=A0A9Q1KUZ3_9CARY|nr:hypothetical protein Cgig2_005552 [Carnegiea gigantea]
MNAVKLMSCRRTEKLSRCLNLGSYNYLGFAAADEYCTPRAIEALKQFSSSTCSPRVDGGTTTLHSELDDCVAKFAGKPAALAFGMGYITNSAIIPVLIGKLCVAALSYLINLLSVLAPSHLEKVLREHIDEGQPRTHRPWKKIIVVVEGIYSMEGELCKLPEIVAICKKYKAYLYLDEAHSIGAVGKTGRGVCELLGVDTADVDIIMGTFAKSFGSCGGYIAGAKELIQYLKCTCPAHLYGTAISPPAAQQILSAIQVLLGEDGSSRGAQRLARIRENKPYTFDHPATWVGTGVAVVVVGFPATPLLLTRARICILASHTTEDLVRALEVISKVGDLVGIKNCPAEPKKDITQLHICPNKSKYNIF